MTARSTAAAEFLLSARMRRHKDHPDRAWIRSVTDGGKSVVVIVQIVRDGVRPITGCMT